MKIFPKFQPRRFVNRCERILHSSPNMLKKFLPILKPVISICFIFLFFFRKISSHSSVSPSRSSLKRVSENPGCFYLRFTVSGFFGAIPRKPVKAKSNSRCNLEQQERFPAILFSRNGSNASRGKITRRAASFFVRKVVISYDQRSSRPLCAFPVTYCPAIFPVLPHPDWIPAETRRREY